MGNLVFQATLGGQVNLVGPNTASTFNLNVPAVSSTIATTSGTETLTNKTLTNPVINGFTGNTSVVNIGSNQFYKDTSGNIGVGVVPSAWSLGKAIEVGVIGAGFLGYGNQLTASKNAYYNAGWKYARTGDYALQLDMSGGQFAFYNAPSGTAGNAISFTQAMTLDASGNLLVGGTTQYGAAKLTLSASGAYISLNSTTGGYSLVRGFDSGTERWSIGQIGFGGVDGMAFYTGSSNTERARIDSSGNLLVGYAGASIDVNAFSVSPSNKQIAVFHATGTSSGTNFINFLYGGGSIGTITQNGTTGVLYNLTSDYRLKNDQQPLTGAKDFVMALQPKKWQWWDGSGEGVGFIAHEFMEVAKYSGNGEKDAVDENGAPKYQSIQPSSSEVMAYLVAHIQELETRLTALEQA